MAPTKFNAERKAKYLEKIAEGMFRIEAAQAVGIGRQTLYSHLRDQAPWRPGESLNLREAIEEAELAACEPVERALYKRAIEGDVKAITLWLTNRNRDRWMPAQKMHLVEHSGQVDHVLDTGPAMERILALQARLEQRALNAGHARIIDVEAVGPGTLAGEVFSSVEDAELVAEPPAAAHVSGCGGPECPTCRPKSR